MKNPVRFLISLLILSALFTTITPLTAQDSAECSLEDGVLTIAWIPKALDNQVFELGQIGAEVRAEELTEEAGGCDVEVFVAAPMNASAEEQAALLMDVIDTGEFDAIAVSCIAPDACVEPINRAVAEGIATMTWDSDSPESDRFTYYGTNNYEAGRAAGDLLVRAMGESGKVGILSGVEGSQNLEERVQGFMDYVADYPDIVVLDVVYGNDDAGLSGELVEQVVGENPDLTGFFFAGLWSFTLGRGAMPTWEAATLENGLINVGFDTLPLELDLMSEGFIHGLVGQKYWDWGYGSVQVIYDYLVNDVTFETFTDTGMDIVTPLNLEAMIAAWESNDFTQPLPEAFEGQD